MTVQDSKQLTSGSRISTIVTPLLTRDIVSTVEWANELYMKGEPVPAPVIGFLEAVRVSYGDFLVRNILGMPKEL